MSFSLERPFLLKSSTILMNSSINSSNWWSQTQTHDLNHVWTNYIIGIALFQNLFLQSLGPFGQLKILWLNHEFRSSEALFTQTLNYFDELINVWVKLMILNVNSWFNSCLNQWYHWNRHVSKPIPTKFESIWTTQNFLIKSWV